MAADVLQRRQPALRPADFNGPRRRDALLASLSIADMSGYGKAFRRASRASGVFKQTCDRANIFFDGVPVCVP